MASIFSYFYTKTETDAATQLEKDFGDFPPHPLKSENAYTPVSIIETRRGILTPLMVYKYAKIVFSTESELSTFRKSTSPEVTALIRSIDTSRSDLRKLKESISNLNFLKRTAALTALLVLSPVVIVLALVVAIRALLRYTKNNSSRRAGFYTPLPGITNEIYVVKKTGKNNVCREAVISHEHIHCMQFLNSIRPGEKDQHKEALNTLLRPSCISQYLLYTLERNEVEARLHEVVLCYYRSEKAVPTEYHGFILMLAHCDNLYDFFHATREKWNLIDIPERSATFKLREITVGADILSQILAFKSVDDKLRFVGEVLPMMYANLLLLYGDSAASECFICDMPEKQFYFDIYGNEV